MKREVIIVNDFYKNPDEIVQYAMGLSYYNPYANDWKGSNSPEAMANTDWRTSLFKKAKDCPFKSSPAFIHGLETMIGEEIDIDHWNKDYPEDPNTGALVEPWPYFIDPTKGFTFENTNFDSMTCRWNCAFNVKHTLHQVLGEGVHNHIEDIWNSVGRDGWTGLIYLNKGAPRDSGLKIMKNRYGDERERFTEPGRWELVDDFANVYNRLLLVRGWMPHVGGSGFGNSVETGRLFQTLFFKVKKPVTVEPCYISV